MRMCRIICRLWPVRLYNIFPHYLINGQHFRKKKNYWTQNVCSEFLYNLSENFPILKTLQRDVFKNVRRLPRKVPIIPVIFQQVFLFSQLIFEK